MTLSEKQVKEFRALHKKVFGKTISKADAMAEGLALIRLVDAIQMRSGGAL